MGAAHIAGKPDSRRWSTLQVENEFDCALPPGSREEPTEPGAVTDRYYPLALREPQRPFRGHRAEQALQRHLHVLPPGQRGLELEPEPRVTGVLPDGLEADGEQVVGGNHARRPAPFEVPERFDRLHAPAGHVL